MHCIFWSMGIFIHSRFCLFVCFHLCLGEGLLPDPPSWRTAQREREDHDPLHPNLQAGHMMLKSCHVHVMWYTGIVMCMSCGTQELSCVRLAAAYSGAAVCRSSLPHVTGNYSWIPVFCRYSEIRTSCIVYILIHPKLGQFIELFLFPEVSTFSAVK